MTGEREALDRIRDLVETPRRVWEPTGAGDSIIGIVVGVGRADSRESKDFPVVTIRLDDDPNELVEVRCMATVLHQDMDRAAPRIGDAIGVVYDGRKTNARGTEYHAYRVIVEHVTADAPSDAGSRVVTPTGATPSPSTPDAARSVGGDGGVGGGPFPDATAAPVVAPDGPGDDPEADTTEAYRVARYGVLVDECHRRDMTPTVALARATGRGFSGSSARAASLEDIELAIGYIQRDPVIG